MGGGALGGGRGVGGAFRGHTPKGGEVSPTPDIICTQVFIQLYFVLL